ncbi:DUF938 domain-containing protein [Actibacterium sp. MT2.3-13A]|uniref:DUF938 domain-containing protein n=1 Tax=Actibacterium sp. MT2.3-13A TaxID=2828332 RepID=UPI001BAE341C|nr:DUF938 domain-containing protein [Actibacterium sp. MT2.3-13A]
MPPRKLHLPDTVALGDSTADGRRFAPSAGRNAAPILELLTREAPSRGRALELASGTGQHVRAFAEALPGLDWQPSDLAPQNLNSIRAWATAEGAPDNLAGPILLDAAQPGWAADLGPFDLIVTVNLLHLISAAEAETLLSEAARALAPGGLLFLYGPFRRKGGFASASDAAFHARLTEQDPGIGYKSVDQIAAWLHAARLTEVRTVGMPANNLTFLARKT